MTLVLRRIELEGFRKFRRRHVVEGLNEGLNVVIEPNETGKSTLLEALRAGFFVRHSTRNQLAQSYTPYGEAVGPEIAVAFEVAGTPWSVKKRFLRTPSVEVEGPNGRSQGEDAETLLSSLLGSVRDTSRGGDTSTYGALGLLWVAQADGLEVTAPGQIVRETVASTLEAEVGSIMGGAAYRQVRERVETQYSRYWSPTGQPKGLQNEARERVETAEEALRTASDRLAILEKNFADLEASRSRLKLVERDMADHVDAQAKTDLLASLEVARSSAQILATKKAEHEAAAAKLDSLEDLKRRHASATETRQNAEQALATLRDRRREIAEAIASAKQKVAHARAALEDARRTQQEAAAALSAGEVAVARNQRAAAITAAVTRHAELLKLEQKMAEAKATAATEIPASEITSLELLDRAVAEAQAVLAAGATKVVLTGSVEGLTLNGEPTEPGELTITEAARFRFGAAELLITPPTTAASAQEVLASALEKRQAAFDELGVTDLVSARAQSEAARDAAGEVRTLGARIEAVTAADALIGLAPGLEALKLFIAEQVHNTEDGEDSSSAVPELEQLRAALAAAGSRKATAEGTLESAVEALARLEEEDAPLSREEAGVVSDVTNATAELATLESRPDWPSLEQDLTDARTRAAEASVQLEEAKRNASAHDVSSITRKIEIIDARARTTAETRTKLQTDVARLEGTIESEGGLGLADRQAAAQDESDAARAAQQRIAEESATLKLLRDTLEAARNETSAKFVGPVARRAKQHIERLLPGCNLSFSEDLALEKVLRAGVDESCGDLSRGTQEQLAILTRIAFADMLLEQGKPVSLILDDPLVYSDDARLDLMMDILADASKRMQVILLTCRDRTFRHLADHRVNFSTPGH